MLGPVGVSCPVVTSHFAFIGCDGRGLERIKEDLSSNQFGQ